METVDYNDLYKESYMSRRPNLIKVGTRYPGLDIHDYRTVLEEIDEDEIEGVKVNIADLVDSTAQDARPDSGPAHDSESLKTALEEAFERGFEAGKTETSKILQSEYEKKTVEESKRFDSVLKEFSSEIEKFGREVDHAVITLALAMARRVVAREIEIDEGAVLGRTREAIRRIIGVDKIKIHVNPADEDYIREGRNELSSYVDSVKEIVIEADEKIERGGCMIESELGNIDARISTQFGIIEETLLGLVKK